MMDETIDLSIVIEMDTKEITGGDYDYTASLREWIRQAEALRDRRCEVLVSSPNPTPGVNDLSTTRTRVENIVTPGASYYGLKNAGGNAAGGELVLFSDSDCRPGDDYLRSLFIAFEEPTVLCVGGPTFYDGTGFLTRMNTTTSFGYLHQGQSTLSRKPLLSHNVAVRRLSFERDVFGPYNGRTRGDGYMTDAYRKRGPVRVAAEMKIFHEDSTYSLRGLLDRQLREIFSSTDQLGKAGEPVSFFPIFRKVMRAAVKRPKRQFRLIRSFGAALGIFPYHYPIVFGVLAVHALLNTTAALSILLIPGWLDRWQEYQFGVLNPVIDPASSSGD